MPESKDAETIGAGWTSNTTARKAFLRGVLSIPSTPAIVLISTFVGFGALARETGLSMAQSVFTTITVFALPGQVVLVDQIGRDASLAAVTFAVMLTAIRLLPLTVSLLPLMRDKKTPIWVQPIIAHFVAITVWIESMRRLPAIPLNLRVPFFLGFAIALFSTTIFGTIAGYLLAAQVPPLIAAALLFLTPIYFFLSLLIVAVGRVDQAAIIFGVVIGPLLFILVPGFDLLLTGLIGGTLAFWWTKWTTHRP